MILIDKKQLFGVTWEIMQIVDGFAYGSINFIINNEVIPKSYPLNYTIGTVFFNLQDSFVNKEYPEGSSGELGNKKINYSKLDLGEELNIFEIETTEIGNYFENCQFGCTRLWLGYTGNKERLIYSTDFNQTFRELILPKNTVETIIMGLPTNSELINHGRLDKQ